MSKRSAVDLDAVEAREREAPAEDELHLRASDLEAAHGIGTSAAVDDAASTLRAMAQSRNDRHVPKLCAALREQDMVVDTLAHALRKAHAEICAGKLDVAKNRIALALSLVEVPS